MDKIKLLEITFDKLSADKTFMAYYLEKIRSVESKSREEIRNSLNCSTEDYYKLGLCKAPEAGAESFEERMLRISRYSNSPAGNLIRMIKTVHTLDSEEQEAIGGVWLGFKNRIGKIRAKIEHLVSSEGALPLPDWFINTSVRLGQAGLSTFVILVFIFNFTTLGKGQSVRDFYNGNAYYNDSIRGMTLRDNTFVAPLYPKTIGHPA